jgi:hypothetical protein
VRLRYPHRTCKRCQTPSQFESYYLPPNATMHSAKSHTTISNHVRILFETWRDTVTRETKRRCKPQEKPSTSISPSVTCRTPNTNANKKYQQVEDPLTSSNLTAFLALSLIREAKGDVAVSNCGSTQNLLPGMNLLRLNPQAAVGPVDQFKESASE